MSLFTIIIPAWLLRRWVRQPVPRCSRSTKRRKWTLLSTVWSALVPEFSSRRITRHFFGSPGSTLYLVTPFSSRPLVSPPCTGFGTAHYAKSSETITLLFVEKHVTQVGTPSVHSDGSGESSEVTPTTRIVNKLPNSLPESPTSNQLNPTHGKLGCLGVFQFELDYAMPAKRFVSYSFVDQRSLVPSGKLCAREPTHPDP